jgi:hypothetical protein
MIEGKVFRCFLTPLIALAATIALADPPQKLALDHLPNAYRIHEKVISGGLPDGEPAFRELAGLAVKTIISVDGAKPEVELAKKYNLRYVHLPHGYDGIPSHRTKELAKAVRDLPGPIYIHCHHGKHRSPAAAAVACVAAALIDPASAETVLKAAGTSANYRGLYQSARDAKPLPPEVLDQMSVNFPEIATIPPLAQAMVAIEHRHDLLAKVAAADWTSPSDHPDMVPVHEALLLREEFAELSRTPEARAQPAGFQQSLRESEAAARQLEEALQSPKSPATLEHAALALAGITKNCVACHQQFRDLPLSEKKQIRLTEAP